MQETMWKFEYGRFVVRADIEPDTDPDLSFDETGETATKIESGEWSVFCTSVSVWHKGAKLGESTLCGSIYENPREFFTTHRDPDPMNRNCTIMRRAWRGEGNPDAKVSICHYFPGMVSEAIAEARSTLATLCQLEHTA